MSNGVPPRRKKEKKLSEEVGGGDAIKLAIKTVGGSYGTLAPFVRAAHATMVNLLLPPDRGTTLAERQCILKWLNLRICRFLINCQISHEAPSCR